MRLFIIVFITLSIILQSCNSVRLKKIRINLKEVSTARVLKNNLRNKSNPYKVYVHTIDSSGVELAQFATHAPILMRDSMFTGMFTPVDTTEINQSYYQKLKSKRDGENCKTRVAEIDNATNLNQLHIYIEDTAMMHLYKAHGINIKAIKGLEKVKRFDKRWLWLTVFLPIVLIVTWFVVEAVTFSQNFLKGGL